jgi:plasmid stabilization system protein ParE
VSPGFHRLAEQEVLDEVARYEEQAPGLGAEFLRAVEAACDLLMRHPQAAPIVHGDVRRLVLRRFPHNIVYSLIQDEPRILAVAHQSRSPHYWRDRS